MDSEDSFDDRRDVAHERPRAGVVMEAPKTWRSLAFTIILRELPYFVMLFLAVFGIGYVSFTGRPADFIWMSLVPVFCTMCIIGGWRHAERKEDRWRLIWTQVLHWLSFFVVMNLVYLPEVRSVANNNAAGINLMTILALATFVAGVHAQAWQICGVGLILALAVPLVAWIEQSALISLILILGLVFIIGAIWLAMHRERRRASEEY
jgi:hypothetical protein